ncbi:class I SAM-dependent methyltransferase [Nocardia neocaledoniensis]|uniref:class I SAM-dependent methyltransferase n=1 Tax=Nocardia neocaledoniensis TaxID=236511 RepID=UPI0024547C01|nr:class I SAM-dependent methyltransferase [Nocardia neocaledoniensis]
MPDDARFEWFADTMGVGAADRVLELGPGAGVSLVRVAGRLRGGRIVGVERSASALGRAAVRCAAEIADGRVRLVEGTVGTVSAARVLAGLDGGARFDLVFAVNVNLFWTGPAVGAWALVRECLAPGGRFWLCYGYGGPDGPASSPKPDPALLQSRADTAGFDAQQHSSGDLLAVELLARDQS